ncbi:DUF1534 domain-containing protein [Pseudomonas syringae pv. tomato]|nr:DUF1534 domain-containing protein [Pseudomonas syringae]TES64961.1 DUF1534 domain-containing protein [Pseudomonas syringae pv. tomato]
MRPDAERRTTVGVSLRTLWRRNAVRDALRHRSALKRVLRIWLGLHDPF